MAEKQNDRGLSGATVYDVARAAGVSAMTVSRVINGSTHVTDSTREKVMAAIESLKYQVNVAARAARVGTLRVGLLYSNPSAVFLSALLVGAMDQCSQSGAQLILENCGDLRSQRKAIDKLIANGADGILVPPPLCDSKSTLKQLNEIGMPTVAVATARPAATGMHLHVPDDLAVCGFDDTPVATTVWPELSTIHQPIGDMARAAVELVIEQIRRRRAGEPKLVQHKLLPYTLVTRESTKADSA
jgi:DNA-binding LacI/PurR family transcriptional regulator